MQIGQMVAFTSLNDDRVTATIAGLGGENGPSGYKRLHLLFEDGSTLDDVLHAGDAPRLVVEPARVEKDLETGKSVKIEAVTEPVGPYWELLMV